MCTRSTRLTLRSFLYIHNYCFVLALEAVLLFSLYAGLALAEKLPEEMKRDSASYREILQTSTDVTRDKYPDAHSVLVDGSTVVVYQPDGTAKKIMERYVKVLTEEGKRTHQSKTYHFYQTYEKVKPLLIEIIRPDGTTLPVDLSQQAKEMISDYQMWSNIYDPQMKKLSIGIPGIEIGDILHTLVLEETIKPIIPETWSDSVLLEKHYPIEHYVYEVQAPKVLPLKQIALRNPIEETVTKTVSENGERIVYHWEIKGVPRVHYEAMMPPLREIGQTLHVSTIPDWNSVSDWYWHLSKPHMDKTTPAMIDKVKELTTGLKTEDEKRNAIFHWVAQEVRYVGLTLEKQAPGFEPHDVHLTFERRHGVCRDKAALLAAMLRLSGFEAFPVLIHVGAKKDSDVPAPYFNHAIVCVQKQDGTCHLMDSTPENTKDPYPAFLSDKSYLVAKPMGDMLRTSPIVSARKNMVVIETTGDIDAAGRLTAESTYSVTGIMDLWARSMFAMSKPEERRQATEELIKEALPSARLVEYEIQPKVMLDIREPVRIRVKYQADNHLEDDQQVMMFTLPNFMSETVPAFLSYGMGLIKRKYPIKNWFLAGVSEKLSLRIDPALGKVLSLPQLGSVDDEVFSWKRKQHLQDNTVYSEGQFLLHTLDVDPQHYPRLKELAKDIEHSKRKMLILKKTGTNEADTASNPHQDKNSSTDKEEDILVHDRRMTIELKDEHSWTMRGYGKLEVRSYKGKKEWSEFRLSYNPVWESFRFIRGTVTTGEDVTEISDDEINIMDAHWVSDAPRYPAERVFVANFPGVEIGSTIEFEFQIETRNKPFFSQTVEFQDHDRIVHEEFKLITPKDLSLRLVEDENGLYYDDESDLTENPVIKKTVTEPDDKTLEYRWEAENTPPIKAEKRQPSIKGFAPFVHITTGEWSDYAAVLEPILTAAANEQPKTRKKALQLTAGKNSTRAKLTAIRDFVDRQIRAAGPDLNDLPLELVTPADRVLIDAYGNAKDRAVLLFALLKAAGFDPSFVLADSHAKSKAYRAFALNYPELDFFDSLLVKVRDGSDTIYLNDTDQYAELGATEWDGDLELDLRTAEFADIMALPDKKAGTEAEVRIKLSSDGRARLDFRERFFGTWNGSWKKYHSEQTPEERSRYFQQLVSQFSQSARAVSEYSFNFDRYPGEISYSLEDDRWTVLDGRFLYFRLDLELCNCSLLNSSDKRETPFNIFRFMPTVNTFTIDLPPEFPNVVLAPKEKRWVLPANAGEIELLVSKTKDQATGGHQLRIEQRIDLKDAILLPEHAPAVVKIKEELESLQSQMVLLERAPPEK